MAGRASRAVPSEGDRHRERDEKRHSAKESRRREPKDDRRHEPMEDKRRRPKEARQPENPDTRQRTPVQRTRPEVRPKPQRASEEKRPDPEANTHTQANERGQHAPAEIRQHDAKGKRAAVLVEEVLPVEAKVTAGENPQAVSPAGDLPIPEAAERQSPVEERLEREEKSKKRKKEKKDKKERKEHRKRFRKEYAGEGVPITFMLIFMLLRRGEMMEAPRWQWVVISGTVVFDVTPHLVKR
jgi:hypothetical protein